MKLGWWTFGVQRYAWFLGPSQDLVYLTARGKYPAFGEISWDGSEIAFDDVKPTLEVSRRIHYAFSLRSLGRRVPGVGLKSLEAITSRVSFCHGNPLQSLHSSRGGTDNKVGLSSFPVFTFRVHTPYLVLSLSFYQVPNTLMWLSGGSGYFHSGSPAR